MPKSIDFLGTSEMLALKKPMWKDTYSYIGNNFTKDSADPSSQGENMADLPLESRCFENNRIFQEDKKTIFAIIKLVYGTFFRFNPFIRVGLLMYELKLQ